MKISKLVALLALILLLSSSALIITPSYASRQNMANWTFMVYMDADNSLSQDTSGDLGEMMSVGSNVNLNIVVLYDSVRNGDSAIYYIEKGQIKVLENLSEVDMGSPTTLKFFLNWTMERYPAKHYFLDFWDHGNFYGGVCVDHGDWLTLREMRDAIKYVEAKDRKFIDVVGFDACRMGSLEVLYDLRNITSYVVASEKDEPSSGWPYDKVLESISRENPEKAAYGVVDAMYNWSKKYFPSKGYSTTMVAVNMSRFGFFMRTFNNDLKNVLDVSSYYSSEILNASQNSERFELYFDMDLYNFMENLEKIDDYKIDKLARDTIYGLKSISYYKVWNCPHPVNDISAKYAHGIGIYFPTFSIANSYYSIDFAKDTYWAIFLNKLFNPNIEKSSGNVKYALKNGVLNISYEAKVCKVNIYLVSDGKLYNYSGNLEPLGNYSISLEFGFYKVYIYGYNDANVVWIHHFSFVNSKNVKIKGKFYLNGELAKGAEIVLVANNRSYRTVQSDEGFSFTLIYPQQINYNTTFEIEVYYEVFHKTYYFKGVSLRGNNTLWIRIDDSDWIVEYFPILIELIVIVSIISVIYLVVRRHIRV